MGSEMCIRDSLGEVEAAQHRGDDLDAAPCRRGERDVGGVVGVGRHLDGCVPPGVRTRVAPGRVREVAVVSVEDYTRALTDATVGLAGPDAVAALAHATRRYARAHPGRYAAVQVAPDPDDPADAALSAAAGRSVQVVAAVLRGFDLPEDRAIDAIRSVRASLHGFVALELGGGFRLPDDLDQSFETHVRAMLAGLAALADSP